MEQNRDRGNIKWTSLMLPEHLERLREWQREDQYTQRPELTDWELQEMQQTLEHGWRRKCELLLKTWHDGEFLFHQGVIEALDPQASVIILSDPFGTEKILVVDIVDVQLGKDIEGI
ncbi:YolD-like family protein [Sporosarcina obsidiansis]|uniref:YolD-like family protein n=1 Tax=Sporosarcina obsidiansis TaxID=2660748 RepID=UPI001891A1C2|nr:YolD-like family protein [Sporosarcina obsidiansis]